MNEYGAIKSARRVMEVLEFFAQQRVPRTVTQVGQALGYPQSSTSMLLTSLETLGYLAYDRIARTYVPTLRVTLLGAWLHDDLFGDGSLVSAMEQLRRRTGQTVMIGLRQDLHVRFILSLQGTHVNALRFAVGVLRPICRSAAGQMLLAHETDVEIGRIARRADAEAETPEDRVGPAALLARIRQIRRDGWCQVLDHPAPDRGALAIALPRLGDQPRMALVIGARKARIEADRERLIAAMRHAIVPLMSGASG